MSNKETIQSGTIELPIRWAVDASHAVNIPDEYCTSVEMGRLCDQVNACIEDGFSVGFAAGSLTDLELAKDPKAYALARCTEGEAVMYEKWETGELVLDWDFPPGFSEDVSDRKIKRFKVYAEALNILYKKSNITPQQAKAWIKSDTYLKTLCRVQFKILKAQNRAVGGAFHMNPKEYFEKKILKRIQKIMMRWRVGKSMKYPLVIAKIKNTLMHVRERLTLLPSRTTGFRLVRTSPGFQEESLGKLKDGRNDDPWEEYAWKYAPESYDTSMVASIDESNAQAGESRKRAITPPAQETLPPAKRYRPDHLSLVQRSTDGIQDSDERQGSGEASPDSAEMKNAARYIIDLLNKLIQELSVVDTLNEHGGARRLIQACDDNLGIESLRENRSFQTLVEFLNMMLTEKEAQVAAPHLNSEEEWGNWSADPTSPTAPEAGTDEEYVCTTPVHPGSPWGYGSADPNPPAVPDKATD